MEDFKNVYVGELQFFSEVPLETPIAQFEDASFSDFFDRYSRAAKAARDTGDEKTADVYQFLASILSFHASFDTPAQPYAPWIQTPSGRAYMPSDLSEQDILALKEIAARVTHPTILARVNDIIWLLKKDYKACAVSAENHVKMADDLIGKREYHEADECYRRALQLALKLGRERETYQNAVASLVEATLKIARETDNYVCVRFMELLEEFRGGDPVEFSRLAIEIAEKALQTGDYRRARAYFEAAAVFHKLAKQPDDEKSARLRAAQTYVDEARARFNGPNGSGLAAASILTEGIEALRRAGEDKDRIGMVRKELMEYQKSSVEEMCPVSTEIDITGLVNQARIHVQDDNFFSALLKFAFGYGLSKPEEIKAEVLELIKKHPLQYMCSSLHVDSCGRPLSVRKGLPLDGKQSADEGIEAEMFSNEAQFGWSLRVQAYIEPARLEILNQHHPSISDLKFLVVNNPFVPPGHEMIFLRGIHAGFHGDFVLASHFLAVQVENSLRYVLESRGVDVSNLMSDGTQPVKVLGAILGMAETIEIFGPELCFELRGCLIEKRGFDFRNRIAHGFATEAECHSIAAAHLWWLVLRICFIPIQHALQKAKD